MHSRRGRGWRRWRWLLVALETFFRFFDDFNVEPQKLGCYLGIEGFARSPRIFQRRTEDLNGEMFARGPSNRFWECILVAETGI